MSNNINSSIERLPVELLHRIFDNLDAETILFSIRPVCRLFQSVVNIYNRYVLNFVFISKLNFYILCRLINLRNVISLTLSNHETTSNQIALFISLVDLQQLTRLRSLTLIKIDECQLNIMLKQINLKILTTFVFNMREYDRTLENTTINLLSSAITQSTLFKFRFYDCYNRRISSISWPNNCTIQYLTINYIDMDDFCKILQCSPHLHTIIMNDIPRMIINNLSSICFQQLTSLTIQQLNKTIDELESFLLLMPSLVYLKLESRGIIPNGKRWEQFISTYLLQLKKFEFYFSEWRSTKQISTDLELIIDPYRTSFWIEHKKWFVTCEHDTLWLDSICLYTIPKCKTLMYYEPIWNGNSLSTYPIMMNKDSSIMNNINRLGLTWNQSIADEIQEKKAVTNHPLFPKVTNIFLEFRCNCPLLSLQSLSILIDISQIVLIRIDFDYDNKYNEYTWINIGIFMEQAHNLSLLIIERNQYMFKLNPNIKNIYSILPHRIKYLEIPIDDLVQIKMILERCQSLSTIYFRVKNTEFVSQVIQWFAENTIDSTCKESYQHIAVWLGKKNIQSTEITVAHKRMNLTDNDLD